MLTSPSSLTNVQATPVRFSSARTFSILCFRSASAGRQTINHKTAILVAVNRRAIGTRNIGHWSIRTEQLRRRRKDRSESGLCENQPAHVITLSGPKKGRYISLSIHNRADAAGLMFGTPNADSDVIDYRPQFSESNREIEIICSTAFSRLSAKMRRFFFQPIPRSLAQFHRQALEGTQTPAVH